MKNYDDLQRFKDKTRTGAIKFKDMSAQSHAVDATHWAIIKQLNLSPDDTPLGQAGSVAVPVPQKAKADEFDISQARPVPTVPAATASGPRSIPGSVSAAVSAPQPHFAPQPDTDPPPPVAAHPATTLLEQLSSAQASAATPVTETPCPLAGPGSYTRLFTAKSTPAVSNAGKDLPLQPLLETIAACR